MRSFYQIPLFWKFSITIIAIVSIFGSINYYFIKFSVTDLFESELIRRGSMTAYNIAERSIVPMAYNDLATLDYIVTNDKQTDTTIAYIFILNNEGSILAHSFEQTVPPNLLIANKVLNDTMLNTVTIVDKANPDNIIKDMALPIMDGNLGTVRIGMREAPYLGRMNKTTNFFLYMVLIFLCFGITGAFFFSYIITTPLKEISAIARKIELGTLDIHEEDFIETLNRSELVKWKNVLNVKDEIDVLISSFGEMVTRLKNTYIELEQAQKSLFHSEKLASLGTLSSGLAHEINNPIAGIQSCIRRLKESPGNLVQQRTYLDLIDEALQKIETVVRGLLNFSKQPELKFDDINVISIINNVLMLASHQITTAKVKVTKDFQAKASTIQASANHIEQVILNLILNSIDAIVEKQVSDRDYYGVINILTRQSREMYIIEIVDNGIGIPKQFLGEIFNPFFSMKKSKNGTGLGLSVSHSIIEQHQGNIRASVNETGGLTVQIKLPIDQMP